MELNEVPETLGAKAARSIRRLTRLPTVGLFVVALLVITLSFLVWKGRPGGPRTASSPPAAARPPVASLAGSPEPGTSAAGDVLPAQRLMPQVGRVLIRYVEGQKTHPSHVSLVEKRADSTQLFWFPLRECESDRKCPYWPWWRRPDVNVVVVPDDFVVGIKEPHNACYGRLNIYPDSDYSLGCQGERVRVVSAPIAWRGTGQLPRTEWLAAAWALNAQDEAMRR